MAESDAHAVAGVLGGMVPVLAADPVAATETPTGRPEIELVLETEWDYLPRPVVDVAYRHGYAPVGMGERAPDYRYVLLRRVTRSH